MLTWIDGRIVLSSTTSPISAVEAQHYLNEISKCQQEVSDANKRISSNETDATALEAHEAEFFTIMDKVTKLQIQMKTVLANERQSTSASASSSSSSSSSSIDVRLPKIELPTFDGNQNDWLTFKDLFTTTIHHSTLSDVLKLSYLMKALKGEAARFMKTMSLTDANYQVAWKLLQDRYHSDREIIFASLRKFTGQTAIQNSTPGALRILIDTTRECIRTMETMKVPVQHWDAIMVFHVYSKIDNGTRELWEQTLSGGTIPTVNHFLNFLEQRAKSVAAGGYNKKPAVQQAVHNVKHVNQNHHVQVLTTCILCKHDHPLFRCSKFLEMSVPDRSNTIKKHNACFNCLRVGHNLGSCLSKSGCKHCGKKHNSLLHRESGAIPNNPKADSDPPQSSISPAVAVSHFSNDEKLIIQSLLATAVIKVKSSMDTWLPCRSLLDGGSTNSYISTNAVNLLGLKRRRTNTEILGLGGTAVGTALGVVTINITPHFESNEVIVVHAFIMNKVTGTLPSTRYDDTTWPHLQDLQLADPKYNEPAPVDILLGADVFYNIIQNGRIKGPEGTPTAIRSSLGYLVGGPVNHSAATQVYGHFADIDLNSALQKFWEIESIPEQEAPLTSDEGECEQIFKNTHRRNEEGRFIVTLPFRKPPIQLGASRDIAIRRLKAIERKLERESEYRQGYVDFMQEYQSLGHMRKLHVSELSNQIPHYYMPHHYVLKLSSTSTKIRCVYDGSSKTSNGHSLNDALLVGPVVQDNLTDIVMRFRAHIVAFTADITKMYRQIRVTEEDSHMQRIVWRENPSSPIQDYALQTVTYGTAPAPYLATRVLQELAENEKSDLPQGAEIMKNDFYVDDCLSGGQDEAEAILKQQQVSEIVKRGGLELRKWCSNSVSLMSRIPSEEREIQSLEEFNQNKAIKTLGLHWHPCTDVFKFRVDIDHNSSNHVKYTKRIILSEMSSIFDPLGWMSPVIITGKILIQSLWKSHLNWDAILPEQIQNQWIDLKANLKQIECISIKRCVIPQTNSKVDLIGYSDSSTSAYSAVCYFRVTAPDDSVTTSIIAAKTRVAPVKTVSLPRLELCGSLLLSELMSSVIKAHSTITFNTITAWTDSTITLAWIRSSPARWKTFVSNRVSKIQSNVPTCQWNHIPGKLNPADCASRGITAKELETHHLWWAGPPLPSQQEIPYDQPEILEPSEVLVEEKKVTLAAACRLQQPTFDISKYSLFTHTRRIIGWILRFINNRVYAWKDPTKRIFGPLQVKELDLATHALIRITQQQVFREEYSALKLQQVPKKSRLVSFLPFLDSHGCLRIGGRLKHANISFSQKHPILLPRNHHLTRMIIRHEHIMNSHAGPQLLLSIIQHKFWIIRGKEAVRFVVKKCVVCTRHAAHTMKQLMGDLPSSRFSTTRAFLKTGVDFCGPFLLKPMIRSRTKIPIKSYIAVFVCFSTRAIHLEIVSELSTSKFLESFQRIISRRGRPTDMYSDNGTNFVGAARELREVAEFMKNEVENIRRPLADQAIKWHFNPPGASNFGGLFEAGVKSVKFHLYRVMGSNRLTYEEFSTVTCQIEACLNSRPLTPVSADPADLQALTPGHFLIGAPLTSPPEHELSSIAENRLNRWQLIQKMKQSFWNRWSNEFITRLQQRPKWQQHQRNIEVGNMVIVKDERLPPLKWRLARVLAVHPGADNLVRVVTLRTSDGEMKRPISKLCLLPVDPSTTSDSV